MTSRVAKLAFVPLFLHLKNKYLHVGEEKLIQFLCALLKPVSKVLFL